jgi:membrane protein
MKNVNNFFIVLKIAFKQWEKKDPFRESAVIAYYAIFSLPGLLVIVTTLAGYLLGRPTVIHQVTDQITATLGPETAGQVQEMIKKTNELKHSFWAVVVWVVTIFIGATGVFAQFQKSLNMIWEVKPGAAAKGIWGLIETRLFSFGLIVSIAFILIVSLVISALLAALGDWLSGHFSQSFFVALQAANDVSSFIVLAVLFAGMFKFVPDAKVQWRQVWVGALVTAFLFEIGKFCMGLYFGNANPATGYGAAGSVILIMLWITYSSLIVFYGAEFTRAFADMYPGSPSRK